MSTRVRLFAFAMFVPSLCAWSHQAAAQRSPKNERDALRAEGLQGAARLRGSYSAPYWQCEWRLLQLADLVRESDLIVEGTAQPRAVELSDDHQLTLTSFFITPARIEKGIDPDFADTLLRVPGGKFIFPDATTAEIIHPSCQKLSSDQQEYWFFLKRVRGGYELVEGDQGIILISDGSVASQARSIDPIVEEVSHYDANTLQARIHELIKDEHR